MKKAGIVIICLAVVSILLGSQITSFANIERAVEGIDDSSNTLVYDLTSISLFAFTASDFFGGADYYDLQLATYTNADGDLTGEAKIIYTASEFYGYAEDGSILTRQVRHEELPLYPKGSGKTLAEMEATFERIKYPIRGFTDNERKQYTGLFAAVLNAVQYIAYILTLVYAILCIVVLIAIDTIGIGWSLIHAVLKIIGLG